MQQYGRSQFADKFAEVAADTDYSRFPALRDITQYGIRAAAEAVWAVAWKAGWNKDDIQQLDITTSLVEQALTGLVKHYGETNELVSVEFQEYWDATDTMTFSADLRERMETELSWKYMEGKRSEGLTVISNRDGIWIFNLKGLF